MGFGANCLVVAGLPCSHYYLRHSYPLRQYWGCSGIQSDFSPSLAVMYRDARDEPAHLDGEAVAWVWGRGIDDCGVRRWVERVTE